MIDPLIPAAYAPGAPQYLHTDWPWPLSLIPRHWTGRSFPHPPKQIAGTAPAMKERAAKPGYPIAWGYHWRQDLSTVFGPDPVPEIGQWTLQAVWLSPKDACWGFWVPCYFATAREVLGKRLFVSCGPLAPVAWLPFVFLPWWAAIFAAFALMLQARPDVNTRDWYWWLEFGSLTWTPLVKPEKVG